MSAGDWKEMLIASQNGDLELVKYHLKMGVDPNYQHPEFMTAPLLESIRFGQLTIAELLLENGADPRAKEGFGTDTSLSIATAANNKAAIRLLNRYLTDTSAKEKGIQKVLVTGGNRGIGKAIARQLLEKGHEVMISVRKEDQGRDVVAELREATGSSHIAFIQGDLSSIHSCYLLCEEIKKRFPEMTVLLNNAGVWMAERQLNEDGLEQSFMTNYLATYILCQELFPLLKQNGPARIVNVNAGLYHKGKLDLEKTPQGSDFHSIKTYATSKLCGVLFGLSFARTIANSGVTINSVHPGVINTGLGDSPKLLSRLIKLVKRFWKAPEYGAAAPVWLATDEDLNGTSGLFYNEKAEMAYPDWVQSLELQAILQEKTEHILSKR